MSFHVLSGDAAFDESRNTSAVRGPAPGAVADALRVCASGHGKDWYEWVVAYGRGEHRHDLRRANGEPAACPVRGCDRQWEGR